MIEELTEQDFDGKVLDSNTGVVVDFYSDFCMPCRPVSAILEKLSGEYDGKVKFYRLDTDKNIELTKRLKITDLPTIIFYSNEKIDIQRGTTTEDKIKAKIEGG